MKRIMLQIGLLTALAAGMGSCMGPNCGRPHTTRTSQLPQIPVSGPQIWTIDGKEYPIEATYIIVFSNRAQYTINYLPADDVAIASLDKAKALELAYPLMSYAYDKGLYQQTVKSKGGKRQVSSIGVAIIEKRVRGMEGLASTSKAHGYRVALTLEEIRERKAATAPSTPSEGP